MSSFLQKSVLKFKAALLLCAVLAACGAPTKQSVIESSEEKVKLLSNPMVVMKTNHGTIYIELYPIAAPQTVKNFLGLALGTKEYTDPASGKKLKGNYYDGLTFHRVIPNFMIQGGDIKGNGSGGPGYKFADEINAKSLGLDRIAVGEYMQYYGNDVKRLVFEKLKIFNNA